MPARWTQNEQRAGNIPQSSMFENSEWLCKSLKHQSASLSAERAYLVRVRVLVEATLPVSSVLEKADEYTRQS